MLDAVLPEDQAMYGVPLALPRQGKMHLDLDRSLGWFSLSQYDQTKSFLSVRGAERVGREATCEFRFGDAKSIFADRFTPCSSYASNAWKRFYAYIILWQTIYCLFIPSIYRFVETAISFKTCPVSHLSDVWRLTCDSLDILHYVLLKIHTKIHLYCPFSKTDYLVKFIFVRYWKDNARKGHVPFYTKALLRSLLWPSMPQHNFFLLNMDYE